MGGLLGFEKKAPLTPSCVRVVADDAMRHADADGDGTIDKPEFVAWFRYAPFWRDNYEKLMKTRRAKEDQKATVIANAVRRRNAKKARGKAAAAAAEEQEQAAAATVMQNRFRKKKKKSGK